MTEAPEQGQNNLDTSGSGTVVRRRWPRRLLTVAVAGAAIGTAIYTMGFSRAPVFSHRVEPGPVVAEVMGTGTLEAHIDATVSPKIQGRLVQVLVDMNDQVSAGQVLARLEDAEWREQVGVAGAGLDAAMATVERVQADEARALAVLAQARLDNDRAVDLWQSDVASRSDLDRSVESLRVAEADTKRASAAITEAERQRVAAEKNMAYHQARLADTEILSPFDGLVVGRDRDPGDMVLPGSSILQVVSTRELWISAWVDETAMARLAEGQVARVVFRSEPAKSYLGKVARLGRQADRETREFLVDVRVSELPANWAIGQRAEVYIETERTSSTLVIPGEFVFWRDGSPGVFVDAEGKARWREVTLGLQGDAVVEITEGVTRGDDVVRPMSGRPAAFGDGQRIRKP